MAAIVVCGGRSYGVVPRDIDKSLYEAYHEVARKERARLIQVLDAAVERLDLTLLGVGDAPGADNLAASWAHTRKIPFKVFEADWNTLGNAAGPARNLRMLQAISPAKVIAFPGSRGTLDCCRQAAKMGVDVIPIDWVFDKNAGRIQR